MKDINIISMVGRLVRNPEVKDTANGIKMAKFTIANNDDYKDKDGKLIEKVSFINCEAYGGLAGVVERYTEKGKQVVVVGRLEIREMEKDGNRAWYTAVKVDSLQLLGGNEKSIVIPKVDHTAQKLPKEKELETLLVLPPIEDNDEIEIPF